MIPFKIRYHRTGFSNLARNPQPETAKPETRNANPATRNPKHKDYRYDL